MSRYDVQLSGEVIAQGEVDFFFAPEKVSLDDLRKIDGDLPGQLRAMPPDSFLLDAEQHEELFNASVGAEATLVHVPEFEKGRHQSAHGVYAGQLVMSSLFDVQKQSHVAIKPFDVPKSAAREYLASRYINAFSRDDGAVDSSPEVRRYLTFNPLGFFRSGDTGQFSLVTRYEPEVISFDNTFWDTEREATEEQVERALARSALGLARLHIFGLIHGDASIKNMAADNSGVRFIDLESAKPFAVTRDGAIDAERAISDIKRDIETLVASLNTGIEAQPRDYRDAVLKAFVEKYVPTIKHPASTIPEEARLGDSDILEILERTT